MSESVSLHAVTSIPHAVYLKDYTVPPYLIDQIELHIDLNDDATIVKSHMRVRHNRASTDQSNTLISLLPSDSPKNACQIYKLWSAIAFKIMLQFLSLS